MNIVQYKVKRDFAAGEEVLQSLSPEDRGKIELVLQSLTIDPWGKQYGSSRIDDVTVKIIVPVLDDEITVLLAIDIYDSAVDVVEMKRRGRFKAALDWIAGLGKFAPEIK